MTGARRSHDFEDRVERAFIFPARGGPFGIGMRRGGGRRFGSPDLEGLLNPPQNIPSPTKLRQLGSKDFKRNFSIAQPNQPLADLDEISQRRNGLHDRVGMESLNRIDGEDDRPSLRPAPQTVGDIDGYLTDKFLKGCAERLFVDTDPSHTE